MKLWKVGLIVLAILVLIFVVYMVFPRACTLEAKICPDGSGVGKRWNCEFRECPELVACDVNSDCPKGMNCYSFIDESFCSKDPRALCLQQCRDSRCQYGHGDPINTTCPP